MRFLKQWLFLPAVVTASLLSAQTPPAPPAAEVSTAEDAPVTFKSRVNLVSVPVVVRDRSGKAVDNLRQEDFQLFDKGKPQIIAKFSIEKPGSKPPAPAPAFERTPEEIAAQANTPATPDLIPPDHFVAYLFDDIHLEFENLAQARDAAKKYLAEVLKPTDRAAIYTTSGQTILDFTDNREQLRETLDKLRVHPISRDSVQSCPDISYYMANQIVNRNDPQALAAGVAELNACDPGLTATAAEGLVRSTSSRVLTDGSHETRIALLTLKDLVRRMSAMPGQRLILFVSPGFLTLDEHREDETDVMDRAIHANVTISALDARGLYTDAPDITKRMYSAQAELFKQQFNISAARAASDILAELADGTGGSFYQNNNDLAGGLKQLSASPEVYYILGFSPQNLKLDGTYHALKVTLKTPGLNTKARRGYYAPRHLSDADEEAKEEIQQAIFSREEMRDIPVEFHTQFFKSSQSVARLVVMTRLDVRKLRFRKSDDRNADDVKIVAGIFDRNGNFLQGSSKTLKMSLKDDTLQNKINSGLTIRSDFQVAPGTYIIRLVVRDAEGQMMSAQNGAVEIP